MALEEGFFLGGGQLYVFFLQDTFNFCVGGGRCLFRIRRIPAIFMVFSIVVGVSSGGGSGDDT